MTLVYGKMSKIILAKDHIEMKLLKIKKIGVYKKIQIFLPQYERCRNMEMKSEIIEILHLQDITKSIIKVTYLMVNLFLTLLKDWSISLQHRILSNHLRSNLEFRWNITKTNSE